MHRTVHAHPHPPDQLVSTIWHGNIAAATWTQRNVSSVTESGSADITITFRTPYIATPCAIVSGGEATNLQAGFTSITASSVRAITQNSGGTATVARKSSVICAGLM